MNKMVALALLAACCASAAERQVTAKDKEHWAFRPLTNPPLPKVKDTAWLRTPIDRFVLAALESKGLNPNPTASPQTLARRMSFDLIGLPPSKPFTPSLVDDLLGSPHYGERWGRHWLDVARYADSDGQESDADRPTAYPYRDFVIRAFNDNLPFNTFVRWQLAGDEIEPDNPQAIAATGFIVACPNTVLNVAMEDEKIFNRFNELDDMVATTGSALLGLTIACARCHDHKYDAIPTRDYYRMLKAFNGGDRTQVALAPLEEARRNRTAQTNWQAELNTVTNRLTRWLVDTTKPHKSAAKNAKIDALKINDEEKVILKNDPENKAGKELAKKFSKELKVETKDYRPFLSDEQRAEWDRLEGAVKSIQGQKPKPLPTALAFADYGPEPRDTWLFSRGDFHSKNELLELGFVSVLLRSKSPEDYWTSARTQKRRDDSTQQRRAMAEWITDTENGAGTLVARVIVNRVWQHHFGEGLVRTVNDFGVRGEKPTHPELLEWLTSEFVRGGWKLKSLHKLIMSSAVYLQDSKFDAAKAKIDSDNRLLWRQRPQRIESEILRDTMLAVSGKLNVQMFGPAFKPPIASEAIQARNMTDPYPKDLKDAPATWRRSVYMFHKRVVQYPLMQAFDGPTALVSCGRRDVTTVAPQGLALLNDRFVRLRAEDFARRLKKEAGEEINARVRLGWQLAFGRDPLRNESEASAAFIEAQAQRRSQTAELALVDFCQMVFAMNEFVYVD